MTRTIELGAVDPGDEDPDKVARDAAEREEALAYLEQNKASETEDFDAFWAGIDRKPTQLKNVFGQDVTLPPSLPLRFEVEARKVAASKNEDDTKRMVGILFGEDALDAWTQRGMDLEQFSVLLMWGTANTRRRDSMSLGEARELYLNRAAGDVGKETAAETSSGAGSASTGRPSKPTSVGNTGSRKKKSRRSQRAGS